MAKAVVAVHVAHVGSLFRAAVQELAGDPEGTDWPTVARIV